MGLYESKIKSSGVVYRPGDRFKAPDWRQYTVENVKELKKAQDELAQLGLKNPWLRNDVWKYHHWPGFGRQFAKAVLPGLVLASGLMVITIAADKMFGLKRDVHLPHNAKYGKHHDQEDITHH